MMAREKKPGMNLFIGWRNLINKARKHNRVDGSARISEGEWVVTIYSVTGTFENEWFGMKPTGKSITYTGVNVDRIKDGKIVEHGGAANLLEPLLKGSEST